MPERFHKLISRRYKFRPLDRDIFGRRKALASEIQRQLDITYQEVDFTKCLDRYLPTVKDIRDKDDI